MGPIRFSITSIFIGIATTKERQEKLVAVIITVSQTRIRVNFPGPSLSVESRSSNFDGFAPRMPNRDSIVTKASVLWGDVNNRRIFLPLLMNNCSISSGGVTPASITLASHNRRWYYLGVLGVEGMITPLPRCAPFVDDLKPRIVGKRLIESILHKTNVFYSIRYYECDICIVKPSPLVRHFR